MIEILINLAFASIFLIVGVVTILWPERVQQYALNLYANHQYAAKLNPFLNWMKTPSYILWLRIIGAMFIFYFFMIFFIFIKKILR